jgi:hypothetical protein
MRLAWFRPATHVSDWLDDTAALVGALGTEHDIATIDEARAYDFIRLDFRTPFDLCVFELADTPQHAYIWPYLLHRPGILRLRSLSLHESRTQALRQPHREHDRALELAFGDGDLTAAPILASRMTIVSDAHAAARLQRLYPTVHVRHAPLGVGWGQASGQARGQAWGQASGQAWGQVWSQGTGQAPSQPPIVGALDSARNTLIQRAVGRARDAGAPLELISGPAESVIKKADIVIAVTWPPADELTLALAGMAAARAVIVLETESTAGWPALDPQTWQPRGWTGQPPIVVSIDPRDEEHSMSLALRRLTTDAALRETLGSAAHEWWQQHATLDHAVRAWRSILAEAVTLNPPPRPLDWPRHLNADGTERARELLGEFGATVDFLT